MPIDYENDLLKHFVRTNGWLPNCKRRLASIQKKHKRRLRYFTFCAVGAMDVLMLDVEKVLWRSASDRFDSVVFFDKSPESVIETRKRIPGAIGFPGNFVETILRDGVDEAAMRIDQQTADPLEPRPEEQEVSDVLQAKKTANERLEFFRQFPFDVINLDLEQFMFRPTEELPGKLMQAIRQVCGWQREQLKVDGKNLGAIDGFSLMFTTQVGPPEIAPHFLDMLEDMLRRNLDGDAALEPLLRERTGTADVAVLRGQHMETFFKLTVPKNIAAILLEADWYVDPQHGITVYEFERPSTSGPYKMLHLVMDVVRQHPPSDKRPPVGGYGSQFTQQAVVAYRDVTRTLFRERERIVVEGELDAAALNASLELIRSRRRKYYPDNE